MTKTYIENDCLVAGEEKFNLNGSLYLRGTQIASLPDSLTVGGSLYLRGTQIASLPDSLTVAGSLDLEDTQIEKSERSKVDRNYVDPVLFWREGKYISVDGVFSEVVSHKRNVYKVKNIDKNDVQYIVTDGNGKYAHGSSLKEAREDLIYKIGSRDKSEFKNLKMDSILTFGQAIEAYRVVTGACAAGTRGFVEMIGEKKEEYSIGEICEMTKGQFGNESFVKFFSKQE